MSSSSDITVRQSGPTVRVTPPVARNLKTGAPGPAGPPGPPGSSPDQYAEEMFTNTSSVVFNHNLNCYPNITVIVGGEAVGADVTYNSANQVGVFFGTPQSGKVVAS